MLSCPPSKGCAAGGVAGVYGYAGAEGRPFAAASVKHGIVVGEVSIVALPPSRQSEDGRHHHAASDSGNKVTAGPPVPPHNCPESPTNCPAS